ncbi:MAG: hypothetical protein KJO76_04710 [Gammaproteobacteria bacterium]|nr:hypothetical protein [Gammaproteobacteria bacterium]
MASIFRLSLLVVLTLAIVGCNRGYRPKACEKPREYHSQVSIDPLQVPEGLDAPDPANSVQIPELPGSRERLPEDSPCLEEPPDYFDTSPT